MGLSRLAISNPAAATDTTLYTSTNQMLVSVIATNKSTTTPTDVRVWVQPYGSASASQYAYIVYDLSVDQSNSFETFRFAVNQNDVIKIRSSTASASFSTYGIIQYDINLGVGISSYSATAPEDPIAGLLWVDSSSSNVLKVYNGSAWVAVKKEESRFTFTATAAQTTVSGADNSSNTLAYTAGYEKVFLNGILLLRGTDYVATNGTSLTGLAPLTAGHILEVFSV